MIADITIVNDFIKAAVANAADHDSRGRIANINTPTDPNKIIFLLAILLIAQALISFVIIIVVYYVASVILTMIKITESITIFYLT